MWSIFPELIITGLLQFVIMCNTHLRKSLVKALLTMIACCYVLQVKPRERRDSEIRCPLGSLDFSIMCLPQMQLLHLDFVIGMSFMRTNSTCMSTCFNLHPKILPCLVVLTSQDGCMESIKQIITCSVQLSLLVDYILTWIIQVCAPPAHIYANK